MLLSELGHDVVATARRPETLDELDVAARLALDIDDEASITRAVDEAGEVDVLVNNAGWGLDGAVETVSLEPVRAMFETNVYGTVRMVRAVLPQMRERASGTIVNVSSVAGRLVTPLNGFYAASKHALEAISEAMRFELAHFGIDVAVVEPGKIATAWSSNAEWLGADHEAYRGLYDQVMAHDEERESEASPPGLVADVIAQAIDGAAGQFRWPAGPDAEVALSVRKEVDDTEWERIVRETSPIEW